MDSTEVSLRSGDEMPVAEAQPVEPDRGTRSSSSKRHGRHKRDWAEIFSRHVLVTYRVR